MSRPTRRPARTLFALTAASCISAGVVAESRNMYQRQRACERLLPMASARMPLRLKFGERSTLSQRRAPRSSARLCRCSRSPVPLPRRNLPARSTVLSLPRPESVDQLVDLVADLAKSLNSKASSPSPVQLQTRMDIPSR